MSGNDENQTGRHRIVFCFTKTCCNYTHMKINPIRILSLIFIKILKISQEYSMPQIQISVEKILTRAFCLLLSLIIQTVNHSLN